MGDEGQVVHELLAQSDHLRNTAFDGAVLPTSDECGMRSLDDDRLPRLRVGCGEHLGVCALAEPACEFETIQFFGWNLHFVGSHRVGQDFQDRIFC